MRSVGKLWFGAIRIIKSESQSPKKTASERESKSLPEAVFYSDFFTYGHGLWSNMWSKVFESVLRAVVQSKINPFNTILQTSNPHWCKQSWIIKYSDTSKYQNSETDKNQNHINIQHNCIVPVKDGKWNAVCVITTFWSYVTTSRNKLDAVV